jgi:uncharacterized membrane protein
MKIYVVTTGILFGLITVAHILRMIREDPHLATDPWYLLITVIAAGLCVWAGLLVWRNARKV